MSDFMPAATWVDIDLEEQGCTTYAVDSLGKADGISGIWNGAQSASGGQSLGIILWSW